MAKNKRIALSVPPDIDAVLTALSKATNTPKTAIITELLSDTLPTMRGVLEAINAAKQGQQELAVQAMAGFLSKASTALNQAHIDFGEIKGEKLGKK